MELNGSHVGYRAKVVYRQRSWPKDIKDAVDRITIDTVHHRIDGKVKLSTDFNYWYPADADIELIDRVV